MFTRKFSYKRIISLLFICLVIIYLVQLLFLSSPTYRSAKHVNLQYPAESLNLKNHVDFLSKITPNRSVYHPESLENAAIYIENEFKKMGYEVTRQRVPIDELETYNLIVKYMPQKLKTTETWLVVGAHYDVAHENNPGADDNASGVAGLLELARIIKLNNIKPKYPIQFVAYTTEEPPYFSGDQMGSSVHAQSLVEKNQNVRMMFSLEMIGFFSEKVFSQKYPIGSLYLNYPWRGNYISLVGRFSDREDIKKIKNSFKAIKDLKTYSISAPAAMPGIDLSDHRNYWERGWPAVMVTDTAFFRNEEYHKEKDTADRLNYNQMSKVVEGLLNSLSELDN